MKTPPPFSRRGVTLVFTLILLAVLFSLLITLLTWTRIRTRLAQQDIAATQANLYLEHAKSDFRQRISPLQKSDQFWIIQGKSQPNRTPPLFLVTYSKDSQQFSYTPLASFSENPPPSNNFHAPDLPNSSPISTRELPDLELPTDFPWINSYNEKGQLIGRYAFICEDLEGKINLAALPQPTREESSSTSPGIQKNPPHAREFQLTSFLPENLPFSRLHQPKSPTNPDSPPFFLCPNILEHHANGAFIDPTARALQLHTTYLPAPYQEQALIPPLPDFSREIIGTPAKNLNSYLEIPNAESELATWIQTTLPDFSQRAGGFPENYLQTLAAHILDYADTDSTPRSELGMFRGIDAYPLISEWILQIRWHANPKINGSQHVQIITSYFAEFHNFTSQPCSLSGEISLESNYQVFADNQLIGNISPSNPLAKISPTPRTENDTIFVPIPQLTLQPNQFFIQKIATISFLLPVNSLPKTLEFRNDDTKSSYELRWENHLAEKPPGKIRRSNLFLTFGSDTKSNPRQKHRACLPSLSYLHGSTQYIDNPGDLRASHTLTAPLAPNDYPDNFSPNRRNVRYANLYAFDSPEKTNIRYRALPSEWPDGGHNAPFSPIPEALLQALGSKDGDERISPDHPSWGSPEPYPHAATQIISNRGFFLSPTELGHIFDPAQWSQRPNQANAPWQLITADSTANPHLGGGNTLRIGRPEHPRFNQPKTRASALLDIFFTNSPKAQTREIFGQINLNTATPTALRAALAGKFLTDPLLAQQISPVHSPISLAPPTTPLTLEPPTESILQAILAARPFLSPSQLCQLQDPQGEPIFGNKNLFPQGQSIEWNDSAAEEMFARIFNTSSVHSRHFRVYFLAQAFLPSTEKIPKILHESRQVIDYFANAQKRTESGEMIPENSYPQTVFSRPW